MCLIWRPCSSENRDLAGRWHLHNFNQPLHQRKGGVGERERVREGENGFSGWKTARRKASDVALESNGKHLTSCNLAVNKSQACCLMSAADHKWLKSQRALHCRLSIISYYTFTSPRMQLIALCCGRHKAHSEELFLIKALHLHLQI